MKRLETNVAILKDFGLGDDRIVKFILSNPEKVMVNPKVLASGKFESKMEVFRGYGWCDSDIALLFRNQPYVLNKSEENIGEKLEFYMKGLGFLEYLRGFEDDVPGLCETYLECVGSGSSAVLLDAGNVKKRGKVVFYYQKPE
ncbi:mitochodrial transcription termination factor [Tanacetum coccineum]|uniref:Mitochodrial transcription termination factor n=1 Tax=Tanacetum coccineum TaxID=301880 RepID=A0ABQ5G704_9ASTR